jgi:hypothetical protein
MNLRWRQTVESKQECHEPEDRVCYLHGELGGCEEQRE